MSQLQSVRVRSQRTAAAAVERARLSLVPHRPSRAPRAPFAVLVALLLGAGVVGLLMFNTHMQQASIAATKLQDRADALQAKSEAMNRRLEDARSPQTLATKARELHMVTPKNPASLDLATGKISGVPTKTEYGDYDRIRPNRTPVPCFADPCTPKVVEVQAPPPTTPTTPDGQTSTAHGPASSGTGAQAGINAGQDLPADRAQGEAR